MPDVATRQKVGGVNKGMNNGMFWFQRGMDMARSMMELERWVQVESGGQQWFYSRSSRESRGVASRQTVILPELKTVDISTIALPLV